MSDNGCCESCAHYCYDPEYDCWCCEQSLDEDEMLSFLTGKTSGCSYFRPDNGEYELVRHQN